MYQKFIINQDGVMKFGTVFLHRDLLSPHERCIYGGGLWRIDKRNALLLYGRSFDFGQPDFDYLRRIDWSSLGTSPLPVFFLSNWPDEDVLLPVFEKPY